MKRTILILPFLIGAIVASAQAAGRDGIEGIWRNRPNTLVVRIAPCGAALCGTVVAADEDAKASTRRAGTANLVGTRVLSELRRTSEGTYNGNVFNPNLNIHASGTVTLVSPTVLLVRGCVLAGLVCRQQHWTRIG